MANMTEFLHHLHGSKLLMLVGTMLMVITTQPTLVKAVDIQGFNSVSACSGSGYTFSGIGPQICAEMDMGSILIRDLANGMTGKAYNNGGCTSEVFSGSGPNVWCFTGGSLTGAAWFNGAKRRRLQGAGELYQCTNSAAPNGVHYTEDLAKGSWVLKTPNAIDVLAWLRGVDDVEKVDWLQAHGAYHVAGSDQVMVLV